MYTVFLIYIWSDLFSHFSNTKSVFIPRDSNPISATNIWGFLFSAHAFPLGWQNLSLQIRALFCKDIVINFQVTVVVLSHSKGHYFLRCSCQVISLKFLWEWVKSRKIRNKLLLSHKLHMKLLAVVLKKILKTQLIKMILKLLFTLKWHTGSFLNLPFV